MSSPPLHKPDVPNFPDPEPVRIKAHAGVPRGEHLYVEVDTRDAMKLLHGNLTKNEVESALDIILAGLRPRIRQQLLKAMDEA